MLGRKAYGKSYCGSEDYSKREAKTPQGKYWPGKISCEAL